MKSAEELWPELPVLLVDDEESLLTSCKMALLYAGINNVVTINDPREVMPFLAGNEVSAIVLDVIMPHISGDMLLEKIKNERPEAPVIMLTGVNDVDTAVNLMKSGAADFITKPVMEARFTTAVKTSLEMRRLQDENLKLRAGFFGGDLKKPEAFKKIISGSQAMFSIFRYVESIAEMDRQVLVTGETGVGKELVAQAVHKASGRKGRFVAVNVAGLDDTLFSDTLFGHTKGAFTGANTTRSGLIETAAEGTLFLDEIGDMQMTTQVKLLRLLQEGEYFPLGMDTPKLSNARIIVATHCDLKDLVAEGKFRKDLYFRLNAHSIEIPPLRERPEDITPLLGFFLENAAKSMNRKTPTPPKELDPLLRLYSFPGNVRELESLVYDAVSRHDKGVLSMEVFRDATLSGDDEGRFGNGGGAGDKRDQEVNLDFAGSVQMPTLKQAEEVLIEEAMSRANNNQTLAAKLLGISRTTLNKRLNKDKV